MENRLKLFFDKYKIVPAQETSRSFLFDCPSCSGKKKLYIQKKDGRSACFKQGNPGQCPAPGSSAPYALSLLTNMGVKQCKDELYGDTPQIYESLDVTIDDLSTSPASRAALPPLTPSDIPADLALPGMPEFADGYEYLKGRGLTIDIIKKYGIGYSPAMRRVIFPVVMNGSMFGWQGRAIDPVDKHYRMYNLPGEWKARTLMFYDNIKNADFAILAEGPVSALKFASVGKFVASMGKEVSRAQLDLLVQSGIKKLYLALDRDAFDKNDKIRYSMSAFGVECYRIPVPDHRDDFGDSTYEECAEAFTKAVPLKDALSTGEWNVKLDIKRM
jgi:hypothetical protein